MMMQGSWFHLLTPRFSSSNNGFPRRSSVSFCLLLHAFLIFASGTDSLTLPQSPCPNVFQFVEQDGPSGPVVGGLITVKSDFSLNVTITLFYGKYMTYVDGKIEAESRPPFSTDDIKIRVSFGQGPPLPQVKSIALNSEVICSSVIERDKKVGYAIKQLSISLYYPKPTFITHKPPPPRNLQGKTPQRKPSQRKHKPVRPIFNPEPSSGECGIAPQNVPLIFGGKIENRYDYPWLYPLFRINGLSLEFFCGANLISKDVLITAAHCVAKVDTRDVFTSENVNNVKKIEGKAGFVAIQEIILHPEYNPSPDLGVDIALLKLWRPVTGQYSTPVCLWFGEDKNEIVGEDVKVIGWGEDENGEVDGFPKGVDMKVISQEECRRNNIESFTGTEMCIEKKGASPCQGDSGSAVMVLRKKQNGKKAWFLRGVISNAINPLRVKRCDLYAQTICIDIAKVETWVKEEMRRWNVGR